MVIGTGTTLVITCHALILIKISTEITAAHVNCVVVFITIVIFPMSQREEDDSKEDDGCSKNDDDGYGSSSHDESSSNFC